MAKPTNENKLTARTAPGIVDGVKLAVLEMGRRKVKYRGRIIGIEGLVGAVMLEFLGLPRDDQERMLRRVVPRVEAMFEAESPDRADCEPDVYPGEEGKASPRRKKGGAA